MDTTTQFRVHLRLNDFLQKSKTTDFADFRFIFFGAGWLVSFFLMIQVYETGFALRFLFLALHFYFWFFFNKEFWKKITLPVELLLALILFFAIVDFYVLNSAGTSNLSEFITAAKGWSFRGIAHKLFLSFALLFTGMLVSENKLKKQGVIVIYTLFFIIGYIVFFYGQFAYLWLFQAFLFFSLLKRTSWLETLTRLELLIYFAVLLWFFLTITEPKFVAILKTADEGFQNITYSLPYYLYMVIKLYWLALLIRIPMVVIYNHASLSRKLRIAGLFQSSFPLFIQLAVLLLIFFLFISGWQASQLRERFLLAVDRAEEQIVPLTFNENGQSPFTINEFEPVQFDKAYPETGVLQFLPSSGNVTDSTAAYFYYEVNERSRRIRLVKINESLLNLSSLDLNLLAGSGLTSYPEIPKRWIKLLYELQFWQKDEDIKINPFGLIYPLASGSDRILNAVSSHFVGEPVYSGTWSAVIFGHRIRNPLLIVGRIELPLVNAADPKEEAYIIDIYYDLRSFLQWNFLTQILLALLILFFILNTLIIRRVISFGSQINNSVVTKFDELKNGIREVSSGNLDYKVNIEGEDEFVELAQRFNQMGIRLQETIEESREKDRLDQEMKMARQVQLSLLPEKLPQIPGYTIVADLETATEVGGDFYDVVPLDENQFVFAIGDVSGKGSSAAFYMVQFISLFRYSLKFLEDPQEIIVKLNDYIMNQVRDRQIFITAIIGVLNIKTNEIRLVRAGHNLPVLLSPKGKSIYREIHSKGLGIGLSKSDEVFKKDQKSDTLNLDEGQKLVLYTDGIVEARRPVIDTDSEDEFLVYGDDRLKDLLIRNKEKDAHLLLAAMTSDLNEFYGEHQRIDDHTILIIERNKDGQSDSNQV